MVKAPALVVKFTERRSAGTVTEAGTVSTVGTLVDNETEVPAAGAAVASWTVQRALLFGVSVVAEHVSEFDPGALATREINTATLPLPRETVTEATWFEVIVPASNWKVVAVAPCATVAEPGKVSRPAGLAETARRMPPDGAGFERVAVQLVELEDIRLVVAQTTDDRVHGATIVSATAWLEPLRVAVMVGVWSTVTAAAVALKVAVLELAGTVTLAGIVMLPVEVNATEAAVAEGQLRVTVQTAIAPGARDDGVQAIPLTRAGAIMAVPPLPAIVSAAPPSDAPKVPEIPTVAEVAAAARVIDTMATMPLAMTLVLTPVATQVELP